MAEGRASMDPVDDTTPQPCQQAAAGSAPRSPPTQPGVPEDTSTSIPSVMATILRALLGPTVGQLFLNSVERALDTSRQWLNRYLPLGERQAVDGAAEGPDSASPPEHSSLLPLGSLSGNARRRAMALVQQLRQKWLDTPHLQHILDVMKTLQQGLEELLRNSQAMWAHRNQAQAAPCPRSACPSTQARPAEGCGTPMPPAGRVLAARQMLAQRLQDTLVPLRAWVGQLPALLQQAARRAQHGMAAVHSTFSRAGAMRELLGAVVARGREVVAQTWEALVVFLLLHLLAPWLEDVAEAAGTEAPLTILLHPQT